MAPLSSPRLSHWRCWRSGWGTGRCSLPWFWRGPYRRHQRGEVHKTSHGTVEVQYFWYVQVQIVPSLLLLNHLVYSGWVFCPLSIYIWGSLLPSPYRGGFVGTSLFLPLSARLRKIMPWHPPLPLSNSEPFGLPLATFLTCTIYTHTPHKSRHGSGHSASQPNLDWNTQSRLGQPPHLQCSVCPACCIYSLIHVPWVCVHPHPRSLRQNLLRRRQSWRVFYKGYRVIDFHVLVLLRAVQDQIIAKWKLFHTRAFEVEKVWGPGVFVLLIVLFGVPDA